MSRFRKGKHKSTISMGAIAIVILGLCFVIGLPIVVGFLISSYTPLGEENSLANALSSYWGAIIGGVISGVFTFLGVLLTICYYKKTDAERDRISVQPFLRITINASDHPRLSNGFALGDVGVNKEDQKEIRLTISNIGNGFANTLRIYTGFNDEGLDFNRVIPVNENAYTYFVAKTSRLDEGLPFSLRFVDSMRNEYVQEYSLHRVYSTIEIDCKYPYLVGRNDK